MATVIRSARVAGNPYLLASRPRPSAAAAADSAPTSPASQDEIEAAPSLQPVPAPPSQEPIDAAPGAEQAQAVKSAVSLADRDALLRQEIEVLRTQALEQARKEGFEAGLVAGEAAFAEQIEAVRSVVAAASEALVADIHGLEDVLIDIAFEAVCRIIGTTLATREGVASVVRAVIGEVRAREQLLVRLSPRDLALFEEHADTLLGRQEGLRLEFVADERVVLGGCIVEVAGGTLDGRLETQLKQLCDTLLGARRIEPESGA